MPGNTDNTEDVVTEPDVSNLLMRLCHDLRTPLRAVLTNAELLTRNRDRELGADAGQQLEFILGGARKADRLVDGLEQYAIALQAEPQVIRRTPLNILVRIALAKLDKELRANDGAVTYDQLPAVQADADRLVQLFESLIRNAVQHRGDAAPRVHISSERQNGNYHFTVKDNGPGIEADYLERIFLPFERLRTSPSAGPGLGLAICRAIVQRHGGKMWAESSPGEGSQFHFTLPADA